MHCMLFKKLQHSPRGNLELNNEPERMCIICSDLMCCVLNQTQTTHFVCNYIYFDLLSCQEASFSVKESKLLWFVSAVLCSGKGLNNTFSNNQ